MINKIKNIFRLKSPGKRPEKAIKPRLRVIHHFACTGGSLFSKCLSAMPKVYLISETHPTNRRHYEESSPEYNPTDIVRLSYYAGIPDIDSLARKIFKSSINVLYDHIEKNQATLILRDHSHADFCIGKRSKARTELVSSLHADFELISLITVRDPIQSFLSLKANNWIDFTPGTFEEYCRRYLKFIESYPNSKVVKYEDFVTQPEMCMREICQFFDIPFERSFISTFGEYRVTGESGRSGGEINERPEKSLVEEDLIEMKQSKAYTLLVDSLGYLNKFH